MPQHRHHRSRADHRKHRHAPVAQSHELAHAGAGSGAPARYRARTARICSLRLDDHTLEVEVARDVNINMLFTALSAQGIEVGSLRNKTNRLEELFIRLVGNKEDAA